MNNISFTVHTFKEGEAYVAYVPELDVSSCGSDADQARRNIQDAVRGFLEAAAEMGTLDEILVEAGYTSDGTTWQAPEFISLDRLSLTLS